MKVHIGKEIGKRLKLLGMTKAEFARRMNRSPQAVQWWFGKDTIDTGTLQEISNVLHFNFFACFLSSDDIPQLREDGVVYEAKSLSDKKTAKLEKELADCKKELKYLKEITELQRKQLNSKK